MGRKKKQAGGREPDAENHLSVLRPFACGLCEEKFIDMRTFYKHFSVHKEINSKRFHMCNSDGLELCTDEESSRDNQFVCDVCYVAFPTICLLHNHIEATDTTESYKILLENRRAYPEPAVCINTTSDDSKLKSKCIIKLDRLPITPDVEVNEKQRITAVSNLESDCKATVENKKVGTFDEAVNDHSRQKTNGRVESQILDINMEICTVKCEVDELQDEEGDDDDANFDDLGPELGNETCGLQEEKSPDDSVDTRMHALDVELPKDISINIQVATKEEATDQDIEGTKTVNKKKRRSSNVHYSSNHRLRKKLRIQRERSRKKKLPVKSAMCEICHSRYNFDEIEAHKLQHLKEIGCDMDLSRENEDENHEEEQPMIRPQRRRNISFVKYADSDAESEDDFQDAVSEKNNGVENKSLEQKVELDIVKVELNEKNLLSENFEIKRSSAEKLAQKVFAPDLVQSDGETKAFDIQKTELELVLEEVKTTLCKGKKSEFKFDGLSFIKTPKRLVVFCPFCGLKITGNRFNKHVRSEHGTSVYKNSKDMLEQVKMIHLRSQDLDVEDTEAKREVSKMKAATDKLNAYVKPEMDPTQVKEAKRRFREKEFYRDHIDYDWDCVPIRTRKKRNRLSYYKTCKLCDVLIKSSKMKHHLAEHLTEKGKKKFSRENLIKCETCARLCTKLGYPQHVCFPELVEKKRKTLLGETELDGEKEKSKPAKIICSECGMLVKRQKMKTHMIMAHSEEKPYTCSTCGKSFKLEGTLNKHMKIVHLAERNFHCDQCTKAFTSASSLKFHYMMHTDERRFQCPKCPKKFRKMYNVKVHLEALHGSGLPKFQCPHCSRQLKTKCALTEHIQRVHMKLKSWICSWPDCSEQFYNAKILRRHMCRHTGEKPLSCDYCECAYVQPTELLAHLKSKHNIHTLPLSKRTSFKVKSYERYIFDTDTSGIDGQKMKSIMFQASNATHAYSSPVYYTPATQTCNSPGVNIPTFSANRLAQVDTETKANCSLENSWTSSGSMTLKRVSECSQYANTPNGASYMTATSVISASSYVEHNQLVNVPSCSGDETGLYFTPGVSRIVPAESDVKPFITDR